MKKHIPNALTCCNLISGCIATCFAFFHSPELALVWIIIGAVFDFFDGMIARLLNVSSPIGKELDSLADDITFGVAPSTIIFSQLLVMDFPSMPEFAASYLPFIAYIMAAFSALRLAKFNLDERQTMGFIGLPTPANALFWGSLVVYANNFFNSYSWGAYALILMIFISCYLLVSEIPMFALKFKHWSFKGNEIRYTFLALAAVIILAFTISNGAHGFLSSWWIVISAYVLFSIVLNIAERQVKA
ncbi:MAG: CDP-diacylglycerol--serine O-phosphatidyltransferase [Prevotella sp.]|nr:CDP-diacylglycerol--serine O-phosphatidyltransferase [Prevotella sp.]